MSWVEAHLNPFFRELSAAANWVLLNSSRLIMENEASAKVRNIG